MKAEMIPRHIDDPLHVLFWSIDEVAPIGLGLVIGMFIGSPLLLAGIGWVFSTFYRRFRDAKPDGFALHFLYWQGLMPARGKTAPNPFIRSFRP